MKRITFWMILLHLTIIYAPTQGQTIVKGNVQNQAGEPLPSALVFLNGQHIAQTDARGTFTIDLTEAGPHAVSVRFLDKEETQRIQADQKEISLHFKLAIDHLLDEVVVTGARIGDKIPIAKTNLSKKEFQKFNIGQDLVYLLNQTPSVNAFSDAGGGIAFSQIRIRGSDNSQVNVTVNGVPLNDSESHGVFWDNMPDFSSSAQSVQIQRGVGSSTNGSGAFGASVNFLTDVESLTPYAETYASLGSFNTQRYALKLGSGRLNNRFSFQSRISHIRTDGYVDRAWSKMSSIALSGAYHMKNAQLKLVAILGGSQNYQAWSGVDKETLERNRRFNPIGALYDKNGQIKSFYPNQINNYKQDHYQLLFSHQFNPQWYINTTLHYTYGRGYYEEYQQDEKLKIYGLPEVRVDGQTVKETDLIRQRWLDNDFYGIINNFRYKEGPWDLRFGASYSRYSGYHFGKIIWARFASTSENHWKYYNSKGEKDELSTYAKATYAFTEKLYGFADLQYRRIRYKAFDIDGKFNPHRGLINVFENFNFINPKAGITYLFHPQSKAYFSYALAQREPRRDDYYNPEKPKPERLHDFEFGYEHENNRWFWNANIYYMAYRNQLVSTGEIDIDGSLIRKNSGNSYRLGLELVSKYLISSRWTWQANLTISANKNLNYPIAKDRRAITNISYSPNLIGANTISWKPLNGFEIFLQSKYIGSQNMTNEDVKEARLNAYMLHNLIFKFQNSLWGMKNVEITLMINNLLNKKYVSHGNYDEKPNYFPQAGIHFLAGLGIQF